MKRKEEAVRNNQGIYKIMEFNEKKNAWVDTGKYRSTRRALVDGKPAKEQALFDNFEDAKNFRNGLSEKPKTGLALNTRLMVKSSTQKEESSSMTLCELVQEWKAFHYLRIDYATQQGYDKRLPHLEVLMPVEVESMSPEVMDELVKYWVNDHPKQHRRHGFDKELDTLKVILNFYRRRKNPRFVIPVFDEHYKAAQLTREAKQPVRSLSQKDLALFLKELKLDKNPLYFPLALSQFCLGLRIGEACGLHWKDIDFETRMVKIESTIVWDFYNWEAKIKNRPKNGKARILVMPEILCEELKRLKAKGPRADLVFHYNGEPLIRKSIGAAYNRILKRVGVDYVSGTHLMRKTSATQANKATGDFYAVSRLLDHATPDVTMRYVEEVDETKHKIAHALNEVARVALHEEPAPKCEAPIETPQEHGQQENTAQSLRFPADDLSNVIDFEKFRKIR